MTKRRLHITSAVGFQSRITPLALAEKVDLPAGRTLFEQGELPDYLYLIRKGKLRVVIGGNCARNEVNNARHIWDMPDKEGFMGATACIVIPWFMDRYAAGADWRSLAYWIHDHLPYSELEFFDGEGMCSFNISWHQKPKKNITSWLEPRILLKAGHDTPQFTEWYAGFPALSPR